MRNLVAMLVEAVGVKWIDVGIWRWVEVGVGSAAGALVLSSALRVTRLARLHSGEDIM